MAVNQHFDFPFKFGQNDFHANVIEQDSDDDVTNCIYLACLTPMGSRFYVPDFGISDPTFNSNRQSLLGELQISEPRAELILIERVVDSLEDDLTIGVGNIG